MPNGKSLRRKLSHKIIDRFGLDTILKRPQEGLELDGYGEPIITPWPFDQFPIRLVIDEDKRREDETDIGGLPDGKHEFIYFFVKGDCDIRIGDKVLYPSGSINEWMVTRLQPNIFKGINVINEVRAQRDSRH